MPDWEDSDNEPSATAAPTKTVPKKPIPNKWQGEDDDNDVPVSDWENSSESEEEKPAAPTAPPKKKGTLKAKLAEKEAAKAARRAAGEDDEDDSDEDDVLDPRAKALRDKQRELEADMKNAAELFGSNSSADAPSDLASLLAANPKTKEDFVALSRQIIDIVIKRHQDKPLYAAFVEQHVKELASPLRDVDIRKAASGLTTLANEKQKEAKDKTGGKKKKGAAKPALGGAKTVDKLDTNLYEEALDDFGNGPDDFM